MMDFDLWYLVFVPVLFIAGWWCRGFELSQRSERSQLPENFSRGLSLVVSGEPDKAIDTLVEVVKLDPDQIDLHHVLGDLFRRRGDYERAIRLHNHLVNRADLSDEERTRALKELARDYFEAGLFDRAESACRRLTQLPSEHLEALRRLLKIYVIEHEWESAIHTAAAIEAQTGEDHASEIAHFCCEEAETALMRKDLKRAAEFVARGLERGAKTPRPAILAGRIAALSGDLEGALARWRSVGEHFPAYLPLVLGDMADAKEKSGERTAALDFLRDALERTPTADALEAALKRIEEWEGPQAARRMAEKNLGKHPSLSAFNALLRLRAKENPEDEQMKQLSGLLQRHAQRFVRYQCTKCGFLASSFSWHCLGCGAWDSFPPKRVEDAKTR